MPVRGLQGRRPPSEPASCHKGRWEDEAGKEGAGRILCAKDPGENDLPWWLSVFIPLCDLEPACRYKEWDVHRRYVL